MMKLPVLSGILDLNYLPWEFSSRLLTWLTAFLAFIALYRFIPNVRVRWREAFWGALLATAAWNLVSAAFTWLLSAGLINYEDIYGPLATTLAFLTWVYVSAFIVVFGAHLSAAVGRKIGRQVQIVPTRVEIPDT
jgi:membrane protein